MNKKEENEGKFESPVGKIVDNFRTNLGLVLSELSDQVNQVEPSLIINLHVGLVIGDPDPRANEDAFFAFVTSHGSKVVVEDMLIRLLKNVHDAPLICDCGCMQFELAREDQELGGIEISEHGIVKKPPKHEPPKEQQDGSDQDHNG